MGDQVLLDEIDDLKETVDNLKQEIAEIRNSYDVQIDALTQQCERIKDKTEAEWKMRLKAADREARERADGVMLELEMMRQAFTGDVGGWELVEGKEKDYYENKETGEIREDEPEVLYVARSMKACEEAKELIQEAADMRVEIEAQKKKIKEMTLTMNKVKTESVSLSKQDKVWKESAKVVFHTLNNVKSNLDAQMTQIMDGLDGCEKVGRRCHFFVPKIKTAQDMYADMQVKVKASDDLLSKAHSEIRSLQAQLAETTIKVTRLSDGVDEEVERLCKPMRERMGDAMMMVMKEKGQRSQERRELADAWPAGHLLPTILMQYRSLNDAEKKRRVNAFGEANANRAIGIEIRANMIEKTKWELKYDDYGRAFYEHQDTGATSEEIPAICTYKPPDGRDAMGNVVLDLVKLNEWKMFATGKGEVYWKNTKTGAETFDSPNAYPMIPKGKTKAKLAAEAAEVVLGYVKGKIVRHMNVIKREKRRLRKMKRDDQKRKEDEAKLAIELALQNGEAPPVIPEKEKTTQSQPGTKSDSRTAADSATAESLEDIGEDDGKDAEDEDDDGLLQDDLSKYMYDIETIEMIADRNREPEKVEPTAEQMRDRNQKFLIGSDIRKFDLEFNDGPSLLSHNPDDLDLQALRSVVDQLSVREEILDKRLIKTRTNINDFSFILLERVQKADRERIEAEKLAKQLERKEEMRLARKEAKKTARRKARLVAKLLAKQTADFMAAQEVKAAQEASKAKRLEGGSATIEKDAKNGAKDDAKPAAPDAKVAADAKVAESKEEKEKNEGKESEELKGGEEAKADAKEEGGADFLPDTDAAAPKLDAEVDAFFADIQEAEARASMTPEELEAHKAEVQALEDAMSVEEEDHPSDDEEEEDFENLDNMSHTSDITGMDINQDVDVLIYGDVSLEPVISEVGEETLQMSKDLINFSVFCGYSNMFIESAPDDANFEFSLKPEEYDETVHDDRWLTASFFISLDRSRVEAIREMTSRVYDADLGLLEATPMATTRLTAAAENIANGRNQSEAYIPYVKKKSEKLSTLHAMWKASQLMMEVIRFQCQKAAVKEAFFDRFKNHAYLENERRHSLMSLVNNAVPVAQIQARHKPLQLSVKKLIATNISSKVWADQQHQCLQISLGGWSVKTKPVMATGRALVWDKLKINAILPLVRLQLDDILVEAFDEYDLRDNVLIGSCAMNCGSKLLGYHTGDDIIVKFNLKDRNGNAVGSVDAVMCVDYIAEVPYDPNANVMHTQINLHRTEVDRHIPLQLLVNGEKGGAVKLGVGDMHVTAGGVVQQVPQSARSDVSKMTDDMTQVEGNIDQRLQGGRADGTNRGIDPRFDHPDAEVDKDYKATAKAKQLHNAYERARAPTKIQSAQGGASVASGIGGSSIGDGSYNQNADDLLSGIHQTLADQQSSFEGLVADLRGNGCNFMKQFTGDFTFKDVQQTGHRVGKETVMPVPDFKKTTRYLKQKTTIFHAERETYLSNIETVYKTLTPLLDRMDKAFNQAYDNARSEHKKVEDSAFDTRNKVKDIAQSLSGNRTPARKPTEPELTDLPEVAYVPPIPDKGATDEKGKKKKQLPNRELKEITDEITAANRDAKDWLGVFGKYWPSQAQAIKINKAINDRNEVLDTKRAEVIESRNRLVKSFLEEMRQWEINEKKRVSNLEKIKKSSRKTNMKLDCYMERATRRESMLDIAEKNKLAVGRLRDLHVESQARVKSLRTKCFLEGERQRNTITKLRKKMLRCLDARRRAFELPRGATNHIQFEQLRQKAEEAVRTLRLEIFETKQLLVDEGVRMRAAHDEEVAILRHEYLRAQTTMEALRQAEDLAQLLEKNQYEVLHLMEAMEKLRMIEADKDQRGLRDTVDGLGERYIPGKQFVSPEIDQCQALIDLVMAKIVMIEGIARSSATSLTCIAEALCAKWGADFSSVRDSWVENSDFERATRLTHDVVQWVTIQRKRLGEEQKAAEKEAEELRWQVVAADEQADMMLANQENDTKYITESALRIVHVMQEHIAEIRDKATKEKTELDRQVTDVTRECQQVREELIIARQSSEEKSKLLWALIYTLQTAAQSLSSRMDIIIEERDKIVVTSKLEADNMKHQLRQERKHSANLLFILHSQRGSIRYLHDIVKVYKSRSEQDQNARKQERAILRREIWEQIFAFTRLSTDVDVLFEFFTSRIANLSGSRKSINQQLANNGAAMVLSALCRSPRPMIRKFASRALGNMGWDGYVETRVLLWDTVVFWKAFKKEVIKKEKDAYENGFEQFAETGKFEALLSLNANNNEEFMPSGNMSLRTIIKQRRQWALRATRRIEGPNTVNQKLINVRQGVIPALLELCLQDGGADWEIAKNAALAISIASYEMSNHYDMTNSQECIKMLLSMCGSRDAEIQTHAAVTIANLCHRDENAQAIFGNSGAIAIMVGMCSSLVVDVLEAATCALANLTCFCDANCDRVMQCGGVKVMVNLVAHAYSENLLDMDQNDEVQANAMEMLANISRVNGEFTTKFFDSKTINAIVLMCAAVNMQVKRHAPLVLGNIGQSEECRELIGDLGGIEALFLVYEEDDLTIKANTLWALCNLMWHPSNQERAGRFMSDIIDSLKTDYMPIKINGAILLANTLYYNNSNRVRFLETDGSMDTMMHFITSKVDKVFIESALRALLSLSYLDNVALWLGEEGEAVPVLIEYLKPPYVSREAMRYALEITANLCVHHTNRSKILDFNGTSAIIALSTDPDHYIQDLQQQIIEYLEDVTPAEVLAKTKMNIGLERMVVLAANADPLVRAVAAESIGEEIWHDGKKQKRALEIGGLEVLLSMIAREDEVVGSLVPALWSLRNILHNNSEAQTQVQYRDGISVLVQCIQRCAVGQYAEHTEKIMEACLACITACIANNERNSRRLLTIGLEAMMDLADGKMGLVAGADALTKNGLRGEGVVALAKSILLMLGPYNYIVCKNCHKKQELVGQACYACGYRLRVEVTDGADRSAFYKPFSKSTTAGNGTKEQKDGKEPAHTARKDKVLLGSQSTSSLRKIDPRQMSRSVEADKGLPAKESKTP